MKTTETKPKHSSWDSADISPMRGFPKTHHFHQDRFSLLTTSNLRPAAEDSIHLMRED